ncbi:MAG: non-homologous end-joining DNA ligase [Verrucomicrobiales bacterium]
MTKTKTKEKPASKAKPKAKKRASVTQPREPAAASLAITATKAASRKVDEPRSKRLRSLQLPSEGDVEIELEGKSVKITNLAKPFWSDLGITKGDLIQYYTDISTVLLPHIEHRAMVMKRYPNGAAGNFFFQKRAPVPRPDWIDICTIDHASGNVIDFPIIRDLASLLWVVNLGCIDLNPWYGRCDDVNRPDYLHFDLDPVKGATFEDVTKTALLVHEALDALNLHNYPKTTGSRGIHIYVPIVRGPLQKQVWGFAKKFAQSMEHLYPDLITAEYKIAKRPEGHVLVDYNQNAWGRTLSSVYSVRPKPTAAVSAPVTWDELKSGIKIEDFTLLNMKQRLAEVGDLWQAVASPRGRVDISHLLG